MVVETKNIFEIAGNVSQLTDNASLFGECGDVTQCKKKNDNADSSKSHDSFFFLLIFSCLL
jgi:hypothetical protein